MEELPEKNTSQSRPEDEPSEAETAPAAPAASETKPEPAREGESPETESPAEEAAPKPATAQTERNDVAEQEGEVSGSVSAASEPEQPRVPEVPLTPEPLPATPEEPAAETAAPPAAQLDAPAAEQAQAESPAPAPEEGAQPNLDELEVTASGAIMVPGEEAPRAEEPRPKKAPARPEKPTGPRISDLRPGQVVDGTVTRIEKYGAFVNLGLVDRRDGLIHISELSPHRIRRVEDVVQVGASVRARVVSVDLGRGRIALSLNDVDAETAKEATVGPAEPAMTSMAMAFQEAQTRQRDERDKDSSSVEGKMGDRKRREQEELMRRLQEGQ